MLLRKQIFPGILMKHYEKDFKQLNNVSKITQFHNLIREYKKEVDHVQ